LEWIKRERCYYQPFARTQSRQFSVKQVALYVPDEVENPSNIGYVADVIDLDIVERAAIKTPWQARRNGQMVLYHLGPVKRMPSPIPFLPGDFMPAKGRWPTRLGLERANSINEVALETEAEWRCWEWLRANRIEFLIRAQSAKRIDEDNPKGRAWFHIGEMSFRYDGKNGFLIIRPGRSDEYLNLDRLKNLMIKP
jgi:uncharacterized protein